MEKGDTNSTYQTAGCVLDGASSESVARLAQVPDISTPPRSKQLGGTWNTGVKGSMYVSINRSVTGRHGVEVRVLSVPQDGREILWLEFLFIIN